MPSIRGIPKGGNIPPAIRSRRRRSLNQTEFGGLANFPIITIAERLGEVQHQVTEAKARGEDVRPQISHGLHFGGLRQQDDSDSTSKPARVYGGRKKVSNQQQEQSPKSYSVTSWETDDYFAVLIEEVMTPNWQNPSSGISVSVHGDILRIVDTRKNAPQAAVIELIIPAQYEPNLQRACKGQGTGYKEKIGVELNFPRKEDTE